MDEKLRVRVTDNALSRDLFPTDYYCLGDNENRPIKWLAIESLLHKQFTGASDVVSITNRGGKAPCVVIIIIIIIIFINCNWVVSRWQWLFYEGWNFNSGNYLFTTDTK